MAYQRIGVLSVSGNLGATFGKLYRSLPDFANSNLLYIYRLAPWRLELRSVQAAKDRCRGLRITFWHAASIPRLLMMYCEHGLVFVVYVR